MAYSHTSASSGHLWLDGVEFRLSDLFSVKKSVDLPEDFNLKDPEVVLEDLEYDFATERTILKAARAKDLAEKERLLLEEERKKAEKEKRKRELAEKHKEFLEMQQREKETKNKDDNKDLTKNNFKVSQNNPFYKDMLGCNILTPQPAKQLNGDHSHSHLSSKTEVDINEFETENPDPFSNLELQTIDDLKELKDVLENFTIQGNGSATATEVKNEDPITHKGAMVEEKMEVPMVVPRTLNHNIAPTKVDLLDEFTDMLTDDVRNTEHSPETVTDEPKSPTFEMSSTGSGQFPTNFTPVATTAYLPHGYSESRRPNSVPNLSRQSPDFIHPTETRTSPIQGYPSTSTVRPCENDLQTAPESEYVNVAKIEKPKVKRKPTVRKKPIADISSAPESHNPNSYGAVRTKVLANKSAQERAKFEETINKALTSLPQLPKPIAKKKKKDIIETPIQPEYSKVATPSFLNGLNVEEKDFAHYFVSMGFSESNVLRAMQKFGLDHKEVADHLCTVQRLSEQGFSECDIEDALDVFNGDEAETTEYLLLQRQFLDMGFTSEKIKQALLLHNRNQSKALEELMSGI